jgi:hypothetical protein
MYKENMLINNRMGIRIYCKQNSQQVVVVDYFCSYQSWNKLKTLLVNMCISYIEKQCNIEINEDDQLFIESNLCLLTELHIQGIHILKTTPDNMCEYTSEDSKNILSMISIIEKEQEKQVIDDKLKIIFIYSAENNKSIFVE